MERNDIYMIQGTNYKEMTMKLLEHIDLADNICGDLDFEEGGNPVSMDRILAFKDPVLCDSFAAEIMGYEPHDVEYIHLAEKLGVGSTDTKKVEIHALNREAETVKQAAPEGRAAKLAAYVKPKDACSACYGSLIYALDRLNEQGLLIKRKKVWPSGRDIRKNMECTESETAPHALKNMLMAARPKR